ncbi:phosphopeptide-binding protein [Amycolatopsis sp. WAC 01375]|uniref:FHA domain-containing protein n=1 Tax=Amycolatopsis sp. WAC 01375 TaxID=2203194 RepID=UPI000F76B812|nr:FHA domain-containing protein [Amycolatopsis sp. WAC 01375]RSM77411.1 phosphopeptide-binding protein [Amycolatopsis sp. WAC 01375]
MPVCAAGHDSTATDYCDVCGLVLGAAPPPAEPAASDTSAPGPGGMTCARCEVPREGRFCEECGFDNDLPAPSPSPVDAQAVRSRWTAVVRADRAWFDEVRRREGSEAAEMDFPLYCPERRFELDRDQVGIGRQSRSRGTNPEIDLGGPPLDPGVSAQHAVLVARSDGGWDVVDLGSTNGTSVGDTTDVIEPNTPVEVPAGVPIRLGAWTVITLERT